MKMERERERKKELTLQLEYGIAVSLGMHSHIGKWCYRPFQPITLWSAYTFLSWSKCGGGVYSMKTVVAFTRLLCICLIVILVGVRFVGLS